MLQIVDLEAGAKLRLVSEAVTLGAPPAGDNLFHKRTAEEWFGWIHSDLTQVLDPARLFSTTNASYFTDVSSDDTMLSLPGMTQQEIPGFPFPIHKTTYGWAYGCNVDPSCETDDPAWDAAKRALVIGQPTGSTQEVLIKEFPTNYDVDDVEEAFVDGVPGLRFFDGTVAFQPLDEVSGPGTSRRTFAGTDGSKVYILDTIVGFTVNDAQDIIRSFGSLTGIQLDGGGSTQMYYVNPDTQGDGGIWSHVGRTVPDVLAVYLGPE
nr:phosphodiester glycosidase family protein [Phytoactinopolyspora mesophila]